ncbi:MAG: aldehyde ferredoxin oxidoreductase family protein [Heliobacteriaceae bacterium]|nr:aldehyde ferredoxin oxidoreductase family protein [Heliobacteriaceae bacterium]MDD4588169.1 aldehyde ferredoxin oxidoreductase family protein [Heliobacteriaceae bacterium]
MLRGWMGRLLRVDLTRERVTRETLPATLLYRYIGGRGIGARLLFDEVGPETGALTAGNKLIFAVGPLTGTKVPTAGRYSLTTKSPLTGTGFESNAGGFWGVGLKKCGFDVLVIEGRASRPIYVVIRDDHVMIKDAGALWGRLVGETTTRLKQAEGKGALVSCIGPAGENLVKMAAIVNDGNRALGRGGVGAVMGSKNLKAIVVRGTRPVPVADRDQLDYMVYQTDKRLKANPVTSQGLPEFGTAVLVNLFNELGVFPVRNFQASVFDQAEQISGEMVAEHLTISRQGCFRCPIKCSRVVSIPAGTGAGPEYETIWSFGADCGVADLTVIAEANFLCNDYGLDPISTGATLACAMELAQRGLLKSPVRFGRAENFKAVLRSIAYREGIGDALAEGSRHLARSVGAEEYAMQVKGLELPAYDPRGLQGMGLAFATANRGGCHLQAYLVGLEVLGIPKLVDRFAQAGKAGLTIYCQNINAAMDTLALCRFIGLAVGEEYFARLLTAVTGETYQPQDLHTIGERIWNLERLYNLREGFSARDDTLPSRLLTEPVAAGPSRGATVGLAAMLAEYYRCRGWDADGVPAPEKLGALGLSGEGSGENA